MTPSEFKAWVEYFVQNPFDDHHRYHRPAALIAKSGSTAEYADLLQFLHPTPTAASDLSDADMTTLKAFGFKPPVR